MAGLLAPKTILDNGSPAPDLNTPVSGVESPINFNAINLKPVNPFAATRDTPLPYKQPEGASKDLIESLTLAIPKAFARFAYSVGEAVPRIAGGLADLAGFHNNLATDVTPPTRIPGLGFLGDIQSYQSEFNAGKTGPGGTALNIATDEPLGLAFKPALAGIGLLAKAFKGIPKELQPLIKDAQAALETQKGVRLPEAVQDQIIFKDAATGENRILNRDYFEGAAPTGALPAEKVKGDVLAVVTKDGKVFHGKSAQGYLKTPTGTQGLPTSGDKTTPTSKAPLQPEVPPTDTTLPKIPKPSSYSNDIKNLANEKLNVDTYNISPEGKGVIERVIQEVKPQIQKAVGKVLTNQETLKVAEDSSKVLTKAIGRDKTLEYNAALLRARQSLAAASKSGKVDEDYIKNLIAVKTAAADAGRTLQALSIGADAKEITGKQAILEAVMKTGAEADKIIAAAKGVDFTDLNQATNFYRQFVKPTATDWIDLIRYNSMLSSPKTHLINAFSNLLNTTLVAPIERAVAGGIDFLGSKLTGNARKVYAGESGAYLFHYFTNVKNATGRFADVMRGVRTFTNLDTKNIPIATSGVKGAVVKTLSFPLKLLEASDQFFTALAEGAETGALKYRAGKGVNVGNIESQAQQSAAYRLFREDLFNENQGHLLDAVDQLTSKLQNLRNSPNPIVSTTAKFTVPFLRTPMNIFKQGLEYSPVGFGTLPGARNKTEQLAKAIVGSTVFAGAAMLLQSNRLTWGEPIDPAQKAAFRDAGMQPYAVKIGNKWVSYQKLPPGLAFPLAMVAAIHDTQQNKQIDDNTVDLVLSGVAKYGQFLADQSYAKSIGDLLSAAKGGEAGVERVVSNYAQQGVPFRALGGWLARLFDNTQRKVDSSKPFIDQQVQLLMMNIPGLSQKVPARTNSQGEPIPNQHRVFNAFSPVQVTTEKPGGSQEFQRLQDIQKANKQTTYDNKQVTANAQAEYNKIHTLTDPNEKAQYLKDLAASNPDLVKKVIQIAKDSAISMGASDQKLSNAPISTRARVIIAELGNIKSKEEKAAYLKDLAAKKILTKSVLAEIAKQVNQ